MFGWCRMWPSVCQWRCAQRLLVMGVARPLRTQRVLTTLIRHRGRRRHIGGCHVHTSCSLPRAFVARRAAFRIFWSLSPHHDYAMH